LVNYGPLTKKVTGAHADPPYIDNARSAYATRHLSLGHVTLLQGQF